MKVMSGVQARLHAALKRELGLLAVVIKDYMPSEYAYEMDGEFDRRKDFDDRVDVVPVSDPNAATMSQRVVQYQATQLAQQAPNLYDMGKLHRQMLEVLGIKDADEIIKLPMTSSQQIPSQRTWPSSSRSRSRRSSIRITRLTFRFTWLRLKIQSCKRSWSKPIRWSNPSCHGGPRYRACGV